MAFVPQEEDENGQPKMTPGTGASPMTQGGGGQGAAASPMQPQRSAMQGGGSGFTNLSSFLSPMVAQQNQDKVKNLGGQLQGQEQQSFNKAADPLRQASFTGIQGSSRDLVNNLVPQPAQAGKQSGGNQISGGGSIANERNGDSLQQLRAMLTQDYNGPTSVNYTPGEAAGKLANLGNADTALNALNPGNYNNNLPSAQYGQGNQWLDQAMLQSDKGTMGEIGNVKSNADAFAKSTSDESTALASKAEGLKNQAAAERAKRKGELEGYGKEMLGGIDTRIGAANAQESADQAGNVLRDPTTGKVVQASPGQVQTNNWQAGGGANRGNMSTEQERGRLHEIAGLLGMDNYDVSPTAKYGSGHYTTQRDPDSGALVVGKPAEYKDPYAGMNPAQKQATQWHEAGQRYWDARGQGKTHEQAMQIANGESKAEIEAKRKYTEDLANGPKPQRISLTGV